MTILPVSRVSLLPQFRAFPVPWFERKAAVVLCCSRRECSSSKFPVRYIPKKSLQAGKPEGPSHASGFKKRELGGGSLDGTRTSFVLEKEMCKGRSLFSDAGRHQVENDYDKAAAFSEVEELLDPYWSFNEQREEPEKVVEEVGIKQEKNMSTVNKGVVKLVVDDSNEKASALSDMEELQVGFQSYDEPRDEPEQIIEEVGIRQQKKIPSANKGVVKAMHDAEKLLIELLARRAFTAVELRKKLHGKRFSPEIVESAIANIQSRGLINDSLYAETYSRSRFSSSSWGPRRIKQALFKKGVSEDDIEKAVKLVFEDGKSGNQESKLGMSKLSMDQLLVQASKQWLRSQDIPKETRKARIIRWLQYRGFNWGVTGYVLKKLESQSPL